LIDFLDQWLAIDKEARAAGIDLPFFFHAGESNWTENENLFEALLLRSQRIGHGLALTKHPLLLERVRDRKIAIEVCPISNQVLGYVPDLRNHPAVFWMRAGIPVTLSPDDPGMMQGTFSHDFYAAFMAWDLDLADLKQLAQNSLQYSSLSAAEKVRAMTVWTARWNEFIKWLNTRPNG
jgi:adenosine deaminase CECR1